MIEHLHRTIRNLYPNAIGISGDSESDIVAKDSDGNEVTLDWTSINAKRTELQADYDAKQYQRDRQQAYPSIGEQLDMQYWDAVNGTTTWKDAIAQVKADNPKPE